MHHRRSYNSITDVLTTFHQGGEAQAAKLRHLVIQQAIEANSNRDYFLFSTDCTPAPRVYSPTLEDRGIIYSPNQVLNNAPITIGHKYSITGFLPYKENNVPPWVLPLSTQRVSSSEDDALLGAEKFQQILNIITEKAPDKLCINLVDSGYCKPKYIYKLHAPEAQNQNLLTIVRVRSNRVFWSKSVQKRSIYSGKRGHELWYGDKFDFKQECTWGPPDDFFEK